MQENKLDILDRGTVLNDRYVLGEAIGNGSFGIIYLAFDTELEHKVALKEYFPLGLAVRTPDRVFIDAISHRQEPDFKKGRERFFSEAETLSRLSSSTDIIGVYDAFTANGTAYYAMEYIRGITISEYVKKHGVVTSEQAMYAALKISSVFACIHDKNIIHRDLSPDNVMITEDGDVRLVDFGNARPFSYEGDNSLTVALRPGYAPLEQYQHYGSQGPWTDIYSLGAVLYFALTQKNPCDPMTRIEDDSEFHTGLSGVNPKLAAIICKMSEIKPDCRYIESGEMIRELRRVGLTPQKFKAAEDRRFPNG
ncbi:MAG: serine/threonine protein kinase [Bacteroides sp.]|nr:serine/threonine protein kinase [Bacteroides sp.]